jgi:hypothetical protein
MCFRPPPGLPPSGLASATCRAQGFGDKRLHDRELEDAAGEHGMELVLMSGGSSRAGDRTRASGVQREKLDEIQGSNPSPKHRDALA